MVEGLEMKLLLMKTCHCAANTAAPASTIFLPIRGLSAPGTSRSLKCLPASDECPGRATRLFCEPQPPAACPLFGSTGLPLPSLQGKPRVWRLHLPGNLLVRQQGGYNHTAPRGSGLCKKGKRLGELRDALKWARGWVGWYSLLWFRTSHVSLKVMGQVVGLKAADLRPLFPVLPGSTPLIVMHAWACNRVYISEVLQITGKKPKSWHRNLILLQSILPPAKYFRGCVKIRPSCLSSYWSILTQHSWNLSVLLEASWLSSESAPPELSSVPSLLLMQQLRRVT